jgi:hypothetical protein
MGDPLWKASGRAGCTEKQHCTEIQADGHNCDGEPFACASDNPRASFDFARFFAVFHGIAIQSFRGIAVQAPSGL